MFYGTFIDFFLVPTNCTKFIPYYNVSDVTGKSFENVRKRVNISLVMNGRKAEKMIAKPTFKRVIIINEDLCLIEQLKTTVTLNKPIYIG